MQIRDASLPLVYNQNKTINACVLLEINSFAGNVFIEKWCLGCVIRQYIMILYDRTVSAFGLYFGFEDNLLTEYQI